MEKPKAAILSDQNSVRLLVVGLSENELKKLAVDGMTVLDTRNVARNMGGVTHVYVIASDTRGQFKERVKDLFSVDI